MESDTRNTEEKMDIVNDSDRNIQNNNQELHSVLNRENDCQNVQQFTNFSIDEILKSTFGRKKSALNRDSLFSAFTPVVSADGHIFSHFNQSYKKQFTENNFDEKIQRPCASLSPLSSCSSPGSPSSVTSPVITSPELDNKAKLWPAWVYCTRYSDRPSSGPRSRKMKKKKVADEKRPRTAFTTDQLQKLKCEFEQSRYLTEDRRTRLSQELNLSESQIKIWFQNKRAKIKKTTSSANPLAQSLLAQGLYNHSTITSETDED